jgi:hypothetical protein
MSQMEPLEVFREQICFLVKDRVVIGEREVDDGHGSAPRTVFSCERSAECAKLKLPCKILDQDVSHYPFEVKFSLKLDPPKAAEAAGAVPWKRRIRPR